MKISVLKNWAAAALFVAAGSVFVSCDKDNGNDNGTDGSTDVDATAVIGDYTGTMSILEPTPTAEEGEDGGQTGTEIKAAKVTATDIEFTDFPIRDLVAAIVGDTAADAIVAGVGEINYSIPYTAAVNEDKTAVSLELEPEVLELSYTLGEGEQAITFNVKVTITAEKSSEYTVESKNLMLYIAAESVTLNDEPFKTFTGMSLEFNLTKK